MSSHDLVGRLPSRCLGAANAASPEMAIIAGFGSWPGTLPWGATGLAARPEGSGAVMTDSREVNQKASAAEPERAEGRRFRRSVGAAFVTGAAVTFALVPSRSRCAAATSPHLPQ
jgi:hypothetical protein